MDKVQFMRRALELAALGRGQVAPNPMVGCVIVKDNRIIGEGWHQKYGDSHAEINALKEISNKELLENAELYVTLEPCSHEGKTPSCAKEICKYPIKKVYICNFDSNPLVSGKGIELLKNAGIEVETGLLEEEGRELNAPFFTFHEKKRPYVVLKWAQTADRFIAPESGQPQWISNAFSRKIVHKWRADYMGIMVGSSTAEHDNPKLNTRDWKGNNPIRIIVDRKLSLGKELTIYTDSEPTITYNLLEDYSEGNKIWIKVQQANIMHNIMTDLYERNVQSVMVEGGATIQNRLISDNLWDECCIFQSKQMFGTGIKAPVLPAGLHNAEHLYDDQLIQIKNI